MNARVGVPHYQSEADAKFGLDHYEEALGWTIHQFVGGTLTLAIPDDNHMHPFLLLRDGEGLYWEEPDHVNSRPGDEALDLLRYLISYETNPCGFDHHGQCQEHPGGFRFVNGHPDCMVAAARRIVAKVGT